MTLIQRINMSERLSGAVTFYESLVFLSGQVPTVADDIRAQTREVLSKIDVLLTEVGSNKACLLNVTIYLQDIQRDFEGMNEVWSQWLAFGQAPARTTVQVVLARPEVLVEISVVAARQ